MATTIINTNILHAVCGVTQQWLIALQSVPNTTVRWISISTTRKKGAQRDEVSGTRTIRSIHVLHHLLISPSLEHHGSMKHQMMMIYCCYQQLYQKRDYQPFDSMVINLIDVS
jgi:hypothetical protein